MDAITIILIVIAVLVTVGLIAWFVVGRHPEQAATHSEPADTSTSETLYGDADRPAGPDAELMSPEDLGGDHRPPSQT